LATASQRDETIKALLLVSFNAWTSVPESTHQVVYPLISKANHTCHPNASVFAPETGNGELVCLRSIAAGDEVTVSYLGDGELARPVEFRQHQLMKRWEFTCSCSRCTAFGDDTRKFSCPRENCLGGCAALRHGAPDDATILCDVCGEEPCDEFQVDWLEAEIEVGDLLLKLPESLYSAWHPCAEFAAAHPHHWLAGRWLRFLASHMLSEADGAEDPEEANDLRQTALEAEDASWRCVQAAVGVSLDFPTSELGRVERAL